MRSIAAPHADLASVRSDLYKVGRALGLAAALPRFFRERVILGQVGEQVRRLLDTRVARFLELARTEIYGQPASPYRVLLEHAGCQFSDLQAHVRHHGLEPTLVKLAGEGVYLTSDEFKGRADVVRGRTSMRVSPLMFERRRSSAGYAIESSGSRNTPVTSFSPLDWRALQAKGEAFFFAAHDLFSFTHAVYEPIITGRISPLLINSKLGVPTDRWFALKVPAHSAAEERYHRANARLVATMGRWFGAGIADPEYVDRGDFRSITRWIEDGRRNRHKCCIRTVVSNAAALARSALDAEFSLEGTLFLASGEPLTESKQRVVEQAGARIAMRYGPGGGICAALGCGHPRFSDEMHVPQTAWTCIGHPTALDYGGPPVYPLLLTTLHPWAPRLLLNVANGDHATLMTRDCGCPLQAAGFTTHIHTVRSFEKLTSEGMNYFGTDLPELLEHTLPSEFGGRVGDYQLVEEEDDNGQTRVTLVVDPTAGALDEERLLKRLRTGLAAGSRSHHFMTAVWLDAGTLRIRREAPRASKRGKVLPLHLGR